MTQPEVPTTSVADLPEGVTLLDVREDDEWAAGHAPGAVHVPLSEVPARAAEIGDGEVAVVCKSGGRSARAVAWLVQNGHAAVNVDGGMMAWAEADRPMESTTGDAPRVI